MTLLEPETPRYMPDFSDHVPCRLVITRLSLMDPAIYSSLLFLHPTTFTSEHHEIWPGRNHRSASGYSSSCSCVIYGAIVSLKYTTEARSRLMMFIVHSAWSAERMLTSLALQHTSTQHLILWRLKVLARPQLYLE